MRGIPVYTQYSVAWPSQVNTFGRNVIEEVGVTFNAKGGGTHGEFKFAFYDLGSQRRNDAYGGLYHKNEHYFALQVCAFTDGLGALLDPRMLRVLEALRRTDRQDKDVTPEKLIEMLEGVGIGPSVYHLRGVLENDDLFEADRAAINKRIARLKKHEAGA
jgi:hypothetical protein